MLMLISIEEVRKKHTNHSNGYKPVMEQIKYLVSVNSYVNQVCT